MRFTKTALIVLALALASTLAPACVLIPVAGFGYTGYQYEEKKGVFAPGQPLGGPAPGGDKSDANAKSSNSKPPPATDNSIE